MEQEMIKKRVVGIDISLDVTTYAIVDVRGEIVVMESFHTLDYPDVTLFVSALSERLINLIDHNGGYESIKYRECSEPAMEGHNTTGRTAERPYGVCSGCGQQCRCESSG